MATLSIPVAKAGNKTVSVDTADFSDEQFTIIVEYGLQAILNSRMSKIGAVTKLEGAEKESAMAAAMTKANENLADLKSGKIKRKGVKSASASKDSKEVTTEALRLAKEIVKDKIRDAGMRPSKVKASDITKAAKALLDTDVGVELSAKAKANIDSRKAVVSAPVNADDAAKKADALAKLQALGGLSEDPILVRKAEAEAAKRKETLSKTQAGKPAPRKRKEAPAATA